MAPLSRPSFPQALVTLSLEAPSPISVYITGQKKLASMEPEPKSEWDNLRNQVAKWMEKGGRSKDRDREVSRRSGVEYAVDGGFWNPLVQYC